MSDPLFQETDDDERRYGGQPETTDHTTTPMMPSATFERATFTMPPIQGDRDGLSVGADDQGTLGDNTTSETPQLDTTDNDRA